MTWWTWIGVAGVLVSCVPKMPAPESPANDPAAVITSPLDDRAYEVLQLDNGMRALIVSDPDTDMAAASLQVHVGHYADPPDREGLAHFLEHMLFMGTDRYPDVEEYRRFVESHGGFTNAGTGGETTAYFFQVEHGALEGAFDRFSRFFVAPVLDPAYVDRERNAVNSEYTLKIQDEARRSRQVRKVTTNPAHPESKFSVGNLDTLADREGSTVHADLKALYDAHYRADQMTVAVVGRQSLDELRAMVVAQLSEVPVGTGEAEPRREPPFAEGQLGVRIDVVPLKERRDIELRFPMESQHRYWPMRPLGYVTSILGHEGDGTLFAALKQAGWIESLSASSSAGADDYDEMSLRIGLTEEGAEHIDEVVAACFAAARQIEAEGVSQVRLAEESTRRGLDFRFGETLQPARTVQRATWALWYYPGAHVLDFAAQSTGLEPTRLQLVLGAIRPDNMRLLVTLPNAETDQVEPLYDVPYRVRPLSEDEKATFTGGSELSFGLPAANPYLPQRTDLVQTEGTTVPVRLSDEGARLELWHLADTEFEVPRAKGFVRLWTPAGRGSQAERVKMAVFSRLLNDSLQEFRYPLTEAGLWFSVSGSDRGLLVTFSGYDDAQKRMLTDLFQRVAAFEVDPARFEVVRDQLVRQWRNQARERPIQQVIHAAYEAVYPNRLRPEAAIGIATDLQASDLEAYAGTVFASASATMFVHGNHGAEAAQSLATIVQEQLLSGEPAEALAPVVRTPSESVVRDVVIEHPDSAIAVLYTGAADRSPASHARWMLLGQLLDTPFFTQLRTEQQLGYVVFSRYGRLYDVPMVRLGIQSGVAGPLTLLDRVDTFLESHQATVAEMPQEEFATVRDGLLAKLREAETELYRRSDRLVGELDRGVHSFDWSEQVAVQVEQLDREAMVAFYAEVVASPRFVVRSFGQNHTEEQATAKAGCATTDCVLDRFGG